MAAAFEGQVVLITGGARGQGRSHALAFARQGADIVFCDIGHSLETIDYELATVDDIAETVAMVEDLDRRCIGIQADVRDRAGLEDLAARAVLELGQIDVLCANAGVAAFGSVVDSSHELWDEVIGCNLTGVWNSVKAVLPHMLDRSYGRIIVTSSSVARHPVPNLAPYSVAKIGLISLVKCISLEHFESGVTANAIAPSMVGTAMAFNEANYKAFLPDVESPTKEEAVAAWDAVFQYGDSYLEPERISDGVLFLASEAASKISGICLDVQAGWNAETPV